MNNLAEISPFGFKDIIGSTLSINYRNIELENFKTMSKSMEVSTFKTASVQSTTYLDFFDENIPALYFTGKGFEISATRKRIVLDIMGGAGEVHLYVRPAERERVAIKPEELFTRENLAFIDTDFNFIAGLILGRLAIDMGDTDIRVSLEVSKKGTIKKDFSHLLSSELTLLFGKVSDIHMPGFTIKMSEELLGLPVKTSYNFNMERRMGITGEESVFCSGNMELKYRGPVDTFKFLEALLNRLNTLTIAIAGGIIERK